MSSRDSGSKGLHHSCKLTEDIKIINGVTLDLQLIDVFGVGDL